MDYSIPVHFPGHVDGCVNLAASTTLRELVQISDTLSDDHLIITKSKLLAPPREARDKLDAKLVASYDWGAAHYKIDTARKEGQNIVLVPMSADIIHAGHLKLLDLAKSIGFVVIMLIDTHTLKIYKRPPIISWDHRLDICNALKTVDLVVPGSMSETSILSGDLSGPDAILSLYTHSLKKLRPNIIIHGDDWKTGTQNRAREHALDFIQGVGGELIEPPYTEGISTSSIINRCKYQ